MECVSLGGWRITGEGAVHALGVDRWSWVAGALKRTSERGEGDVSPAQWSSAIGRGWPGGPDRGGVGWGQLERSCT